MGKPKRIFSKTIALKIFSDEENFELMKNLDPDQLIAIIDKFMQETAGRLGEGTNVILKHLGAFRLKYPNAKSRRCFDIHTKEMVQHKIYPKVQFITYFKVKEKDDESKSDRDGEGQGSGSTDAGRRSQEGSGAGR